MITTDCIKDQAGLVSKCSRFVFINENLIKEEALKIFEKITALDYSIKSWKSHPLHPQIADEKALHWIFVLDSLNFCFWTLEGSEVIPYQVNYKGLVYSGYWALCAVLNAIFETLDIFSPSFLESESNLNTLRTMFNDIHGNKIPLLEERIDILRCNLKILNTRFGGNFANFVKLAENDVEIFLGLLLDHFPSFRDIHFYDSHKVPVLKRAQILISDIWGCFENQGIGRFNNIQNLTMFADYRVPQILLSLNLIKYDHYLMNKLLEKKILLSGSQEEIEIRCQSICCIELLKDEIQHCIQNLASNHPHKDYQINSIIIDFFLWDQVSENNDLMKSTPMHLCRSIYY